MTTVTGSSGASPPKASSVAPLLTRGDDLLVQSSFHVLRMYAERRDGTALRVSTDGPTYQTRGSGDVPMIDASAIIDGATLQLFCVNRSTDDVAPVELEVPGSNGAALRDGELLTGTAPDVVNTFEDPDAVAPVAFDEVATTGAGIRFALPPLACTAFTLDLT